MRVLQRRRDPQRGTQYRLVLAVDETESIAPGEMLMLDGLGACFVLGVGGAEAEPELRSGEQTLAVDVEALAYGTRAPDIP